METLGEQITSCVATAVESGTVVEVTLKFIPKDKYWQPTGNSLPTLVQATPLRTRDDTDDEATTDQLSLTETSKSASGPNLRPRRRTKPYSGLPICKRRKRKYSRMKNSELKYLRGQFAIDPHPCMSEMRVQAAHLGRSPASIKSWFARERKVVRKGAHRGKK